MATAKKASKPESDASGDKPTNKKTLMMMVVTGMLLAGAVGGGAAWYFLGQQAPVDPLAAALPAPPKPPVFSALDTFIVNLQPEMGEQYLQVAITLQLEEQAQADQIKTYMPMVRSRLLALLSSKRSSELITTEGKNKLAEEVIATLNEPFVPGTNPLGVTSVFFTAFVIQ